LQGQILDWMRLGSSLLTGICLEPILLTLR
jgi:hypothetical protein